MITSFTGVQSSFYEIRHVDAQEKVLLGLESGLLYFMSELTLGPVCFICTDFVLMEIIFCESVGPYERIFQVQWGA